MFPISDMLSKISFKLHSFLILKLRACKCLGEGAKEDTEREEDGQKRYSVLTHDDVGVHGIGLQSQLQVENDKAYVVQQMEETEKIQQVLIISKNTFMLI